MVKARLLQQRRRMMTIRGQLVGERALFVDLARSGGTTPPDRTWWMVDRLESAISGATEAAEFALAGAWSLEETSTQRRRELAIVAGMARRWL